MGTEQSKQTDVRRGVIRRFIQVVFGVLIQGGAMFGSARRLDWGWGWALIGVGVGFILVNALLLTRRDPELIAERGRVTGGNIKRWDRPLAGIVSLWGPLAIWIVSGLDDHADWSPDLAIWIHWVALVLVLLGYVMWGWAMNSNPFFAGFVRIQEERGHTVATKGAYRLVRHPGYAGMTLFTLMTPLMLGSLWGLIPAGLTVMVGIVRTALEDRTLLAELPGYQEYAQRTRYRLLPGVW